MGGSSSHCDGTNRHYTKDLELKFFLELYQLGVDLAQVKVQATQDGAISVNFPWQYHRASTARLRSITFIQADITKPDEYPSSLQKELNLGFDIFYMKAAFYVPYLYKDFLPCIAQSIRRNGWLMTADVTIGMDFVNPEKYLNGNGQAFISKKSREVEMFEDFMQMAFDPLCTIPQLEAKFPRAQRVPGTELSYWAVVHPRQKIMPTI